MVLQAHVVDPFTGLAVERIQASAFSGNQLLSARGNGSVTVPITREQPKEFLRPLLEPWSHLIVLERDGVVKYAGYPIPGSYRRGSSTVTFELGDLWAMISRRIMTAPGVTNIEKWSYWIENQPRAAHAALLLLWNRDRGSGAPLPQFPLTIPGGWTGELVTRPYYGYEMVYVDSKIQGLMDEGLDVFFEPQWIAPGQFGWVLRAGDAWGTGVVREFDVTAERSPVSEFTERVDGARVTNNADRVGEGSEVDMLVRSWRNTLSPLPLLERITMSKTVSDPAQLLALARQDTETYSTPTVQWDFKVTADTEINPGDTARLMFSGDAWIPDGIYERRVVGVTHDMSDMVSVAVQPSGGA